MSTVARSAKVDRQDLARDLCRLTASECDNRTAQSSRAAT